jgi:hypothetical protein
MIVVMAKLGHRACIAGIVFFTIKGLLWLSVPVMLAMSGCWN